MLMKKINSDNKGAMLVMALVFTSLFTVMAVGIAGVISSQHKLGQKKINWNQALGAAEAGINYYRWHLAHDGQDYWDGNGEGAIGPFVRDYKDNLGNNIGKFSLEITPPAVCTNDVIIESTGWMNKDPDVTRTVKVKYGRQSMATFAFLTNSNVWFGDSEILSGPLHSNGGIRMDGFNDGVTTSFQQQYICGYEHGCGNQTECSLFSPYCSWVSGQGCECNGIWGVGGEQELWDFPVSNVDFDAISTDLNPLLEIAQNSFCSASDDCHFKQMGLGYRLEFLANGSFNAYRVKKLKKPVWGFDGSSWIRESDDIDNTELLGNYIIPDDCGIIFVEDDLWIDGVVNGNVTVVAARLPDTGNDPKMVINGNLTYATKDGSCALGLIAQSDIYVPLYAAPNNLEINAVLLAQKGHVYRKHYTDTGYRKVIGNGKNYILRDRITLYGSIITNKFWTWSWVDGTGQTISGYQNTESIYDPNLTYNPPPGFPTTGEYRFLQWEETTEKQ